jgi:adenylyltransferase/sulfurtransferase
VENSNLSRSVLFRESDNGKPKAEVAAAAARSIFPKLNVRAFHGDIIHDLGLGVFRWADIVLGGLDNREARLAINRNCWKVNRPWIDGAIEQIQGIVRFFAPDGPCYECTMSERDWKILQQRRSCNLLTKEEMQEGRTPTTPTISSIIAGVQCQEAVKHLHGLPTMQGLGWVFEGLSGDSYSVQYQKKEDCYSHDILDEVISLDSSTSTLTVRELLQKSRELLGENVEIELAREMIHRLVCPACGVSTDVFKSVSQVKSSIVMCPNCDGTKRELVTFFRILGNESFLDSPLADIGIPPYDIIFASTNERRVGFELTGDATMVLGTLLANEDAVEWT